MNKQELETEFNAADQIARHYQYVAGVFALRANELRAAIMKLEKNPEVENKGYN